MSPFPPVSCCGKQWDKCRCPVLPPEDKDKLLEWYRSTLEYIATEETCQACKNARELGTISLCSRHRPAWLMAKGALNGWKHKGGMPFEEPQEN